MNRYLLKIIMEVNVSDLPEKKLGFLLQAGARNYVQLFDYYRVETRRPAFQDNLIPPPEHAYITPYSMQNTCKIEAALPVSCFTCWLIR